MANRPANTGQAGWPDAALILVGHGSSRKPDGDTANRGHADAIRRLNLFAEVRTAFLKEAPFVDEVLAATTQAEVYIVPNLACRGTITGEILPRAMGLGGPVTRRDGPAGAQTVRLCEPAGTHPGLAEVMAEQVRALAADTGLDPADTEVIVVGHGNEHDQECAIQTRALGARLAALGIPAKVSTAFLEQAPRIDEWAGSTAARSVIVVPFLMAGGPHASTDLPARLGLNPADKGIRRLGKNTAWAGPYAVAGRRLWVCRPVGSEPAMCDIILDRVATATDAVPA